MGSNRGGAARAMVDNYVELKDFDSSLPLLSVAGKPFCETGRSGIPSDPDPADTAAGGNNGVAEGEADERTRELLDVIKQVKERLRTKEGSIMSAKLARAAGTLRARWSAGMLLGCLGSFCFCLQFFVLDVLLYLNWYSLRSFTERSIQCSSGIVV